jgi:hypothetical protein
MRQDQLLGVVDDDLVWHALEEYQGMGQNPKNAGSADIQREGYKFIAAV